MAQKRTECEYAPNGLVVMVDARNEHWMSSSQDLVLVLVSTVKWSSVILYHFAERNIPGVCENVSENRAAEDLEI